VIDEAILTVMKAPKSYTKEDVVEINCHGGTVPLRRTLEGALKLGARLAEPGEFTKRAFLNGRIDLTQAEAVLDVVKAKTDKALSAALTQLEGKLSGCVSGIKDELLDIKAHLEASIDFPDEEISPDHQSALTDRLNSVKIKLEGLIESAEAGRIAREGINCVICGKPNAGKSSLMNALLKEERVIVTPVPGTTRDAVSEWLNRGGLPVNITDTAGITAAKDPVEKEGVIRSKLYLEKADLVLFVADLTTGITAEDMEIIGLIKGKEVIGVLNKADITPHKKIELAFPSAKISALKKINLEGLLDCILDKIYKGGVFANDYNILVNARHKDSLVKAAVFVDEALHSYDKKRPEEVVSISIAGAISALGEVTGESVSEEVLGRIFSRFCVGK
jgi:tRNA modification GTPase